MKLFFCGFVLLQFFISPIFASSLKDTVSLPAKKNLTKKERKTYHYLILTGTIKQLKQTEKANELPLDSAVVLLLDSAGNIISEHLSTIKKPVVLKLKLEKRYTIKIQKGGYVPKFFEVNTSLPKEKLRLHSFRFDLYLYEKVQGVDYSLLNKAVAIIEYIPKHDKFDYDYVYTREVNKELKQQYKDLYYLKKD